MSIANIFGITNAYAASVPATSGSSTPTTPASGLASMLPMIVILIVFMYLLVIRPQSKRAKAQRALMEGIKVGDEVITSGGIFGKINKITDDSIMLEIAGGVEIKIQRVAIAAILPKGTVQAT